MANDSKQFDPNDLDSIDALLDEVSQKTDDAKETEKNSASERKDASLQAREKAAESKAEESSVADKADAEAEEAGESSPQETRQPQIDESAQPSSKAPVDEPPEIPEKPDSTNSLSEDASPSLSREDEAEVQEPEDQLEKLKQFAKQSTDKLGDEVPSLKNSSNKKTSSRGLEVISKTALISFLSVISILLSILLVITVWTLWSVLSNSSATGEGAAADSLQQIHEGVMKLTDVAESHAESIGRLEKKVDEIYFRIEQSEDKNAVLSDLPEKPAQETPKQADKKDVSDEYARLKFELKSLKRQLVIQNSRLKRVLSTEQAKAAAESDSGKMDEVLLDRLDAIEQRMKLLERTIRTASSQVEPGKSDSESYQYKGPKPPKFYEDKVMESYP